MPCYSLTIYLVFFANLSYSFRKYPKTSFPRASIYSKTDDSTTCIPSWSPTKIEILFQKNIPFQIVTEGDVKREVTKKSKELFSARDGKPFDRTNRIEGQKRWIHEIRALKAINDGEGSSDNMTGIGVIIELAKELLYSGIPEQVLELYAAYYDLIMEPLKGKSNPQIPVVPDTKLILTTIRAFIALADVTGAINLLQAVSRAGLEFDSVSKSVLISDLAECSPQGLQVISLSCN